MLEAECLDNDTINELVDMNIFELHAAVYQLIPWTTSFAAKQSILLVEHAG